MQELDAVSEVLRPYDAAQMRCFPVSARVNHVANDDEDCSRAVAVVENQSHLLFFDHEDSSQAALRVVRESTEGK